MFNKMFEYSLENGKKQFKQGFILFLISSALCIIASIIFKCINSVAIWLVCFYGLIMIILLILLVFAIIKIIFGAIVYHAERTSKK